RIVSIRQKQPLGLGHAVLCAKEVVGDEPFVVFLSDDIIRAEKPAVRQLCEVYERYGASTLAVMQVPREDVSKYGIIIPADAPAPEEGVILLRGMVEKPSPEEAPSDMAIIGRYVLDPGIFPALEKVTPDAKGEIQLTDGLRLLLQEKPIYAYAFEGKRYDAGSKLGFLQATVEFALSRDDLGPAFRDFLRGLKL
ncbi:MAG: UTP--glucose-1-phosphate uridylyltransferase, partial [bacterium]|nr:UTP--glucose-1-phosphate uridylyltransferase [bacterium]